MDFLEAEADAPQKKNLIITFFLFLKEPFFAPLTLWPINRWITSSTFECITTLCPMLFVEQQVEKSSKTVQAWHFEISQKLSFMNSLKVNCAWEWLETAWCLFWRLAHYLPSCCLLWIELCTPFKVREEKAKPEGSNCPYAMRRL